MKKIITAILTVSLLCAMFLTSFAENSVTISGGSSTCTVKGKYNATGRTDVYSVDITWGGMEFDYNASGDTWNTKSLQWEGGGGASWAVRSGSSNTIKFANYSSAALTVSLAFSGTDDGITGAFKNNADGSAISSFSMDVGNSTDGATTYTANFMPSGALLSTVSDYTSIGTITVTLDGISTPIEKTSAEVTATFKNAFYDKSSGSVTLSKRAGYGDTEWAYVVNNGNLPLDVFKSATGMNVSAEEQYNYRFLSSDALVSIAISGTLAADDNGKYAKMNVSIPKCPEITIIHFVNAD